MGFPHDFSSTIIDGKLVASELHYLGEVSFTPAKKEGGGAEKDLAMLN